MKLLLLLIISLNYLLISTGLNQNSFNTVKLYTADKDQGEDNLI